MSGIKNLLPIGIPESQRLAGISCRLPEGTPIQTIASGPGPEGHAIGELWYWEKPRWILAFEFTSGIWRFGHAFTYEFKASDFSPKASK